jgi:hypothetical protein
MKLGRLGFSSHHSLYVVALCLSHCNLDRESDRALRIFSKLEALPEHIIVHDFGEAIGHLGPRRHPPDLYPILEVFFDKLCL